MYFLDLLGTFAFSVTGAFRAKNQKLTIFGTIFLGVITALGGGTLRDLIINRTPLFYLRDPDYLLIAVLGSIITFFAPTFFKKRFSFFRFIDSIGLASFAIIGVSATYNHVFPANGFTPMSFLPCVAMGMVTAFFGGVIRDALLGDTPFAFRPGSNYALSAFLGSFSFYILMFYNVGLAIVLSFALTIFMREAVSKYGLWKRLKIFPELKKNGTVIK